MSVSSSHPAMSLLCSRLFPNSCLVRFFLFLVLFCFRWSSNSIHVNRTRDNTHIIGNRVETKKKNNKQTAKRRRCVVWWLLEFFCLELRVFFWFLQCMTALFGVVREKNRKRKIKKNDCHIPVCNGNEKFKCNLYRGTGCFLQSTYLGVVL